MILPSRCLELDLAVLSKAPFEPIRTYCLKYLTWKTDGVRFSSTGVTLFTRLEFLPKVYTKTNMSRPIFVPAMRNQTDSALRKLCVHRALNEYVRCSSDFRQDGTHQLFDTYGRRVKGKPISKQSLKLAG